MNDKRVHKVPVFVTSFHITGFDTRGSYV